MQKHAMNHMFTEAMTGVSIFLPVYNEERIIRENITRVYRFCQKAFDKFEVIVIDDSSTDNTLSIIKDMARSAKELRYLHYDNGPSRRENLAVSFKKAKYGIVAFMDVDLATDIRHLKDLILMVENGADVAIGSRYKGIRPKREWNRLMISKIYNTFMKIYFGSKVSDHQCGFKAARKGVMLELVKEMGYEKKLKRGWFWDTELLLRAQKKGLIVKELAVNWIFGSKSEFRIRREIKMIGYVFKLRWRL